MLTHSYIGPGSHRILHLHCRYTFGALKSTYCLLVTLTVEKGVVRPSKRIFLIAHSRNKKPPQAKAMSAFLSGEMKDTVQVHPAGAYGMAYLRFH